METPEVKLTGEERRKLIALIQRKQQNPYLFFTPNGAQENIINAIGNAKTNGKRIFLFSAANGVGKTSVSINIMANLFFDSNREWFDLPLFNDRWRIPKLFWHVTKDSTLKETIEPEIRKWFPPNRYELTNEGKQHIYRLRTDTGFTVFFKTIDQDPDTFESATLGGIFLDEPPPEKIYQACVSRLRAGGYIFAFLTPLHKAAWILDRWIMNDDIQDYFFVQYADVWSNSIERGVRGRLRTQDIEFMISQFDPEEREAREKGLFTHLKGLVYKDFKKIEPYVIEPFDVTDPTEYQIYVVLDPHDRRYPAIGWYAVDRAGQYYVVNEWPNLPEFNGVPYDNLGDTGYTFADVVKKIDQIDKDNRYNVVWRKIDPNRGRAKYGNSGMTVQEEFERAGMYFDTYVNDDLEIGHARVRDLLKTGNLGRPGIQVFNTCQNHIRGFLRYSYDENTGKSADKKMSSEKVLERGKDFMDVVRYFAVGEHRFIHKKADGVGGWRAKLRGKRKGSSFMAS